MRREPVLRTADDPARDDDQRVPTITRPQAEALLAPESERDPRVPYERIVDALLKASAAFPLALSLRPIWSPAGEHEVQVEVWERAQNGHVSAQTVAVSA